MAGKIRLLDVDQRLAFEIILKYGKDFMKATKKCNPCPKAPLLFVHGGAGTGKSHLINVMCQSLEKVYGKEQYKNEISLSKELKNFAHHLKNLKSLKIAFSTPGLSIFTATISFSKVLAL